MKIHAVIDTNVLISALISPKSDSATVQILDKSFDEEIIPLYNQDILKEYKEVMNRPKFHLSETDIDFVIRSITEGGIEVEEIHSEYVFADKKDKVFYEVYLSFPDSYLITGNIRHFPKQDQILSPSEMIKILQ